MLATVFCAVWLAAWVAPASAQSEGTLASPRPARSADPDAVAAVARRLNCPLCQGYSLQDCPLVVCSQMRDLIAEQLAAGATDTEVIADFVAQYGPQVLNEPPRSGFHLVAWILPVVVLALGATVAGTVVGRDRRQARQAAQAPNPDAPGPGRDDLVNEEALARVEDLVARP